VLLAVLWMVASSSTRALVLRAPPAVATFAFSLSWAALDTLLIWLSPFGAMGSLSTSQVAAPLVIQVASLAGSPGVVFLLCLPAGAFAVMLHSGAAKRWRDLAPAALVVVAALAFGAARLSHATSGPPISIALAAIDRDAPGDTLLHPARPAIWDQYTAVLSGLPTGAVDLIVLPEAVDQPTPQREPTLLSDLAALARKHRAALEVGVADERAGKLTNRAWVFGPDGRQVADYAKHHPAPGELGVITPGTTYSTFEMKGRSFGVAICKDMDYPALARTYRQLGATVLVVPAADFDLDDWMHARMAVLRGVEEGLVIIRSAEHGMLTVSDPYGRVLAAARSEPGAGRLLSAIVPLAASAPTLYTQVGDVFGSMCVVLVALLLVGLLAMARRRPRSDN
jgi:apolipoprotein N-acyltransferase